MVEASADSGLVPSRLDASHLHTEADAEEGNLPFASEFHGCNLALAATLPESSRNEDSVQRLELGRDFGVGMLEEFGIEPLDRDLGAVGDAAVDQRLAEALVSVRQADIFADDPDRDLAVVMVDAVHDLGPAGDIGARRIGDPEGMENFVVEARFVILQRHVVDVAGVERRDDRRFPDIAEQGDLLALGLGQCPVAAAQQDLRLDAEAGKFPHRLLGRLGLELSCRGNPRNESRVHADRLVAAEVVPQLADRFDERQAFNVADRPTNLANDEVQSVDLGQRELLDRVGDVRDDLDGGSEIITAPFLGDDVAVDSPGGDVVGLLGGNAGEAFIVTEVEVGLRTVIGHIDFAVLIRRHRPRIDV